MKPATVPLASLLKALESGARPKGGVTIDGDVPSLGGEHVGSDGRIKTNGVKRIPRAFYDNLKKGRVKPGDILIVKDGATTGKTAYVPEDFEFEEAAINEHVFRLEVDDTKAAPKYVAHFLQSGIGQSAILADFRGATVGGISRGFADRAQIPLPSIEEQRRIAAMLDKAEELRAKRRSAIALLDQLPQAIFLEMFGDPVTNPENWHVRTIEETTECLDRFRKPVKASDRPDGPIPYYGANGLQGWIDRALFNESLVLVAEDGGHFENPTRGVAYRIDGPAWVNNHAHILRAKANVLDVEFLHRVLRHYNFVPFISGTTRSKLTQGQLAKATIPVPPIDLQRRFAASVESTNRAKAAYQSALAESDTLFASLLGWAFDASLK
ncbi:MAG: restriction endonuclease subunit S [Fimbriimonadales bacterium]|nr:restriction endonuclease subunit S [Fimbriimonadales bacterium]